MKRLTCIVTDHVEPILEYERLCYKEAGVEFRSYQLRKAGTAELIEAARMADVLVVDQARITEEVLAGLDHCKLIIRHGDGYDNLDLTAATKMGIVCANEPGFWSREVAEQALALALSLALKLPVQQDIARKPRTGADAGWDLKQAMPFYGLQGLTAGIVGCGKIGSQALELFKPIVARVMVHDPLIEESLIRDKGGIPVALEKLLAQSDVVSLHLPLDAETEGLFNTERLSSMKRGSILINTARGALVDTEAAADACESGHLSGLALDTTNPEPLTPDHRLFRLQNVIITPHLGWYSESALQRMREQIVADVLAFKENRVPTTLINPEVLDSITLRTRSSNDWTTDCYGHG